MKLNIIIPNYNGCKFLGPCLSSLQKQTFTDFCITVVDNGSSDQSCCFLAKHYPQVRIINFSHNKGFAAAANAGILSLGAPFVMLLNNDTVLAPSCIESLMYAISQDHSVFSAGASILSATAPYKVDTTGDYYSLFGYAFCRNQGYPARPSKPGNVFTNCGCAVIYRRSLLKRTGLFAPGFFAYLEDVDLGMRAKRLGYRNIHVPKAIVYHHGSGTTGQKYTRFKVYYSARNNILLRRRNLTRFQRLLHAPFTICGTGLKYLYFRKYGLHKAYLKGCIDGLYSVSPDKYSIPPGVKSFFCTEPWFLYGTVLYTTQFLKRKLTF